MRHGRAALPVVVLFAFVSLLVGCADSVDGRVGGPWQGAVEVPGPPMVVGVDFTGRHSGEIDIPAYEVGNRPLTEVVAEPDQVEFGVPDIPGGARFAGRLDEAGGAIVGDFSQAGDTFGLTLNRTPAPPPIRPQEPVPPYPYLSEDISFPSGDITVAGTLTRPAGTEPVPAVVLATGSGPQDRNEEIAGHRPFLVLADTLTRAGYAVLRTDDRGVGGTGGNLNHSTYTDLADDIAAGLTYLRGRADIDAGRIGLLGHSEGGYLAPLVAARPHSDLAFVILMAAPAVPGTDIVLEQGRRVFRDAGASPRQLDAYRAYLTDWTAALRAGQLTKAARLSETYLRTVPDRLRTVIEPLATQNTPYMAALASHDPAPALAALRVPTLAFFGSADRQVTVAQNVAPMRALLADHSDATVRVFGGLNHLMQPARTGLPVEYEYIETTIAPEVLDTVTGWLGDRA